MKKSNILEYIDDEFHALAFKFWSLHVRELDQFEEDIGADAPGGVRALFYAACMRKLVTEQMLEPAKEATIAWSVCASIHREYAKGKDPVFTTRQSDFTRHEDEARSKYAQLIKLIDESPV